MAPLNNIAILFYKFKEDAFLAACYTKIALQYAPDHVTLNGNYDRYITELSEGQLKQLSSIHYYEDILKMLGEDIEMEPIEEDASSADISVDKPKKKIDFSKEEIATDPYQELEKLVGMNEIKADVLKLVDVVKMQQVRKEMGMKTIPMSLHLVFTGNPGTGKTTVARILAKIYKEIGILSTGQLVEVDRSGLVAGYVGQTALKTQEKIDAAIGGILFIDEAYTLMKEGNDFGQEAVDTLLKAMEDYRDNFVVIVAGYPEQMNSFVNSNPGLKSRFNKYFHFPDYTADEMIEIFFSMCSEYNYRLEVEAEQKIRSYFQDKCASKDKGFANARDVRNAFEIIVGNQATRLMNIKDAIERDMLTITERDIENLN